MTTEQKIIKSKVGVLELAKQLGNLSKACQLMGYSRIASTGSKNCTRRAVRRRYKRSPGRNRDSRIASPRRWSRPSSR